MFKKFKDKLKSWTKKVSKEAEAQKEDVKEESEDKEKKAKKLIEKAEEESKKKEILKELKKEIKFPEEEIKPLMKFDVGRQKFEPDLDKLKEDVEGKEKEVGEEKKIEEAKKEENIEEPEEKKSFFAKVKGKIGKVKITEEIFNVYSEELEMLLLENNVAIKVAEKITEELKKRVVGKEILKKEVEGEITESFKDIIYEILIEPFDLLEKIKEKSSDKSKEPYVILFCGINGTGKTTTIAKIAEYLKENKVSCVLAAADTFRAASIEQLKTHGEKIGVNVISSQYGADPASIGFDAIRYAKKNFIDCVLIDTAGRMHTSKNLLKEIEKIDRICKPDTKVFVGESITGNDVIEQAKSFNFEIGIDGIILTKADIDDKGGSALSVGYITKKPILFLGTGQDYDKIEPFSKQKFIEKLGL